VYIIHLREKIYHSQHYVGLCYESPYDRLEVHRSTIWEPLDEPIEIKPGIFVKGKVIGNGAKFLAYANFLGIHYDISKIYWNVNPWWEVGIKATNNTRRYCPTCMGRRVRDYNPR
jgi:hypothetical protein